MTLGKPGAMRIGFTLVAVVGLGFSSAAPAHSRNWDAIDALRQRLEAKGARVVQRDCQSLPRVQGLYHRPSDQIVICRVHQNPAAVWDTLAHEAAHRMQDCAGGLISRPEHRQAMVNTLARYSPEDISSLRAYPSSQHNIEIEARYTAKLPPQQVMQLFDRYCSKARTTRQAQA